MYRRRAPGRRGHASCSQVEVEVRPPGTENPRLARRPPHNTPPALHRASARLRATRSAPPIRKWGIQIPMGLTHHSPRRAASTSPSRSGTWSPFSIVQKSNETKGGSPDNPLNPLARDFGAMLHPKDTRRNFQLGLGDAIDLEQSAFQAPPATLSQTPFDLRPGLHGLPGLGPRRAHHQQGQPTRKKRSPLHSSPPVQPNYQTLPSTLTLPHFNRSAR